MRRLLICLGMLSLACLASPKDSVEVAAKAFWGWHALRQPSGTLTADQLAEVRRLVTKEFACLLEVAGKFNLHFAKLYPDRQASFRRGNSSPVRHTSLRPNSVFNPFRPIRQRQPHSRGFMLKVTQAGLIACSFAKRTGSGKCRTSIASDPSNSGTVVPS